MTDIDLSKHNFTADEWRDLMEIAIDQLEGTSLALTHTVSEVAKARTELLSSKVPEGMKRLNGLLVAYSEFEAHKALAKIIKH